MPDQPRAHLPVHLLTSVGARQYEPVEYELRGRPCSSAYCPAALVKLLAPRLQVQRATIIATKDAIDRHYHNLAEELRRAGVEVDPAVEIPLGGNEHELETIFERIAQLQFNPSQVVLDVTYSLRHLPFVLLAALSYLRGLEKLQLAGVYYGAFEAKDQQSGRCPVLDLTWLVELLDWFSALRSFHRSGGLRELTEMLAAGTGRLFRVAQGSPALGKAKDAARWLEAAHGARLPLEVGIAVARLKQALEELRRQQLPPPLQRALAALLEHTLRMAVKQAGGDLGRNAKQQLVLDRRELERQLAYAELLAKWGDGPAAFLVLREWMINAALWAQRREQDWLDYEGARRSVEVWLNGMAQRLQLGMGLPAQLQSFVRLWQKIRERRNAFAHAGMTQSAWSAEDLACSTTEILKQCHHLLDGLEALATAPSAGGRLVVTPLGLAPGVLFTAVRRLAPDRLLIVTSEAARGRIDEALACAGRPDLRRTEVVLADPHEGWREIEARLVPGPGGLLEELVQAAEVVVNITGGTTALQISVERIAERARSLGVPQRRVALVDRRSREEQDAAPYVEGEVVEFDEAGRAGRQDSTEGC
ncbi:MAG: hypothetical protein KatS3mg102_1935 [Planctomycetota bacterium]|nr:MAG: hypothetical protein KatS3mg102_1935 [Planctomycetota bacterium]